MDSIKSSTKRIMAHLCPVWTFIVKYKELGLGLILAFMPMFLADDTLILGISSQVFLLSKIAYFLGLLREFLINNPINLMFMRIAFLELLLIMLFDKYVGFRRLSNKIDDLIREFIDRARRGWQEFNREDAKTCDICLEELPDDEDDIFEYDKAQFHLECAKKSSHQYLSDESDIHQRCSICREDLFLDDRCIFKCGHACFHDKCAEGQTRCPICREFGGSHRLFL